MGTKSYYYPAVEAEPVSLRQLLLILIFALVLTGFFILYQSFIKYRLFITVNQEVEILQERLNQTETEVLNIRTNINQIMATLNSYRDVSTESVLAYEDRREAYPSREKPVVPETSPFIIRDDVFPDLDNFHYIADYPDPRMDSQSYSNELLIKDMQFSDEETDFDWSLQTQKALQDYLDNEANLPNNTSVLHMECRSSLCKVVIAYPHYRAYKTSNSMRVFEHSYPKFGMMRYQFGTPSYEPSGTYFVYYYFMRDTYKG